MTKRVAFYVRVSTDGQTVENQLQELRDAAKRNGWDVVATFADKGISGTTGRDGRPDFDGCCQFNSERNLTAKSWSMVSIA